MCDCFASHCARVGATAMLHLLVTASTGACPSTCTTALVYEAAKIDMMKYVDLDYTCDANIDFMSGMIGHHAGVVLLVLACEEDDAKSVQETVRQKAQKTTVTMTPNSIGKLCQKAVRSAPGGCRETRNSSKKSPERAR